MIELYVYSTKMSPENQGVFQLLKEVNFRRILAFCSSRKWGHFEWRLACIRLACRAGPNDTNRSIIFIIIEVGQEIETG